MLLLLQLLISIISAESTETTQIIDSDNECYCPKEEIFDSNLKEGSFKSPGCEYWNNKNF